MTSTFSHPSTYGPFLPDSIEFIQSFDQSSSWDYDEMADIVQSIDDGKSHFTSDVNYWRSFLSQQYDDSFDLGLPELTPPGSPDESDSENSTPLNLSRASSRPQTPDRRGKNSQNENQTCPEDVFINVRLSNGDCFVFNEFLVAKMLQAAKVNNPDPMTIANNSRDHFIQSNQLTVKLEELERALLHSSSNEKNPAHFKWFPCISKFYLEKVPILIFLGGIDRLERRTLANHISDLFNIPTVLGTDTMASLIDCTISQRNNLSDSFSHSKSIETNPEYESLSGFRKRCRSVHLGLMADIKKTYSEGKSIIIEGQHITSELLSEAMRLPREEIASRNIKHQPIVIPIFLKQNPRSIIETSLLDDLVLHQAMTSKILKKDFPFLIEQRFRENQILQLNSETMDHFIQIDTSGKKLIQKLELIHDIILGQLYTKLQKPRECKPGLTFFPLGHN